MSNWAFLVTIGVLSIILGIIGVVNPQIAGVSVSLIVAIGLIILGVLTIFFGFSAPSGWGVFWAILIGLLMLAMGIFMIRNPLDGFAVLESVIAILTIVSGVIMLMAAFTVDMGSGRVWSIVGGIASFVLAYFLFTKTGSLGFLVGLQLIFYGIGIISLGLAAKRTRSIYY